VLDVGCGEGADAVWLASGGWDVTALEVSGVALGVSGVALTATAADPLQRRRTG
jgi:2-polyprenyl-3-methyl-5-hydroxy-6-metoxy-1,4-benzoquinol methylase